MQTDDWKGEHFLRVDRALSQTPHAIRERKDARLRSLRRHEVARLYQHGMIPTNIARELQISLSTVRKDLRSISP